MAAGPARRVVLGGGLIVMVLALWQWYADRDPQHLFVVSSPARTVRSLAALAGDPRFWTVQARASAEGLVVGWVVGVGAGLLLGLLIGWYRALRELVEPVLFGLNSVPHLALIPLVTLWLGYGQPYKVVVVAASSFFPVVLNTAAGLAATDRRLVGMSRSFGASWPQVFRTVSLPASLPVTFAGLRQSLTHAITGLIGAEIWSSSAGLGWVIANAEQDIRTDVIIATVVVVTVAGLVLTELLHLAEARLTRWQRDGVS